MTSKTKDFYVKRFSPEERGEDFVLLRKKEEDIIWENRGCSGEY